MESEQIEFYFGLCGAKIVPETFDFGGGLYIRKTYAHLMKPMIMAFSQAQLGKSHPGPWKAVSGSTGYDIHIELHVSLEYQSEESFDALNIGWWIVALLRLYNVSKLFVPVVSEKAFIEIPKLNIESTIRPIETGGIRIAVGNSKELLAAEDLHWVKNNWKNGAVLMRNNKAFSFAFRTFDQGAFSGDITLYYYALWSALEALFSPAKTELRFRISSLIASYLEPPGQNRLDLHKEILKLYDARSSAIHGSSNLSPDDFAATHQLLRRIIIKMIEEQFVPGQHYLENRLFGIN